MLPNTETIDQNIFKKKVPKLNISIQNVCSLNISKPGPKLHSKLIAITKSESEIIFICDTRLNSNIQIAGINDIKKKLNFLGYSLHHNSTKSSRGVAILISNKIILSIEDTFCDADCNILLLKIRIDDVTFTLGSIYGLNNDDENFFNLIRGKLESFNSDYNVIGGDWNTTLDGRVSRLNIDIVNTVNPPSTRRSLWLNQLLTSANLADPYRHFNPNTQEYTFIPFAADAINRSRLDFFLISNTLLEQCINCRIPHCLVSSLFDHKQVTLSFKRENPYKKQTLNDAILTDADLKEIVEITTVECYINHLLPSETLSDIEIENYKITIDYVCSLYKGLVALRLEDAEKGTNPKITDRIGTTRNAIKNNLNLLPSIETLQSYNLSCGRDVFLEILIMSIKNSSLAHQHNFFKIKNAKRKSLENKIKCLKKEFQNNTAEILQTERDLGRIVDDEMREEVLRMKMFEQLNNEKITPYFLSLAKKPQQSENLLDVRKDNGEPFDNAVERDSYIKNYFAETYKKIRVNEGGGQ
jgi:exonuclease III